MNTEEEKKITEVEQPNEIKEETPTPAEMPAPAETPTPEETPAPTEAPTPEEMPAPAEVEPEPKAEEQGIKQTVAIGEVAPMSEEEKAAKAAAQSQNFNSQEKVVYKMKAEKDANPLGVVIFFIILIAFSFFLPKIVSKYGSIFEKKHNYFNTNSTVPSGDKKGEEKPDEPEEEKDPDLHSFSDPSSIKKGDISFLNFVKSNNNGTYELAFSMMNDGETIFDFSKKFFIEFYSGDIKIGEKLIYSYDSIAPKAATQFVININKDEYENSNNYKVVEKTIDDYPIPTLATSDGDYKTLTCINGNNELVYYFKEDLLEKIDEDTKVPNSDPKYQDKLAQANTESINLRAIEGIDSAVIETSQGGMDLKTNINLEVIPTTTLTSLKQYKYFKYHEQSSVVKYEAKGIGYTCS